MVRFPVAPAVRGDGVLHRGVQHHDKELRNTKDLPRRCKACIRTDSRHNTDRIQNRANEQRVDMLAIAARVGAGVIQECVEA
jgi:hypothetical protein